MKKYKSAEMKYRIEIEYKDAEIEVYKKLTCVPLLLLLQALDKSEIKYFKISLD